MQIIHIYAFISCVPEGKFRCTAPGVLCINNTGPWLSSLHAVDNMPSSISSPSLPPSPSLDPSFGRHPRPLSVAPRFIHVKAYEMCSWKGKPVVRVEDIVTDELERESLSMHPKSSDERHVAESHRIALFQHYVYQLSGHEMVVTECESVIRSGRLWKKESVWSKPCVSSQDS